MVYRPPVPGRSRVPHDPVESSIHYPIASDFKERMQLMERTIKDRLLANPSSKMWTAQLMIIECLKGKCKVTDLFSWTTVR